MYKAYSIDFNVKNKVDNIFSLQNLTITTVAVLFHKVTKVEKLRQNRAFVIKSHPGQIQVN